VDWEQSGQSEESNMIVDAIYTIFPNNLHQVQVARQGPQRNTPFAQGGSFVEACRSLRYVIGCGYVYFRVVRKDDQRNREYVQTELVFGKE